MFGIPILRMGLTGPHVTGASYPTSPPAMDNLMLWFKADAGTLSGGEPVSSSQTIDQWENQSTTGSTDALQATAGNRPKWKENIVNGLPVIEFSASLSQYLTLANNGDVDVAGQLGFFCVIRMASVADYRMILTKNNSPAQMQYEFRIDAAGSNYFSFGSNNNFRVGSPLIAVGSWYRLFAHDSGSLSETYVNNSLSSTGGSLGVITRAQPAEIGRRPDGYYGYYELAELGLYNAGLNEDDRNTLDSYLKGKYGLS